jgi:hypothetical protein
VSLPLGWFGVKLYRLEQLRALHVELERRNCTVHDSDVLSRGDQIFYTVVDWFASPQPRPIDRINAGRSDLDDSDLAWIAAIDSVIEFDLDGMNLTGAGIENLLRLPRLTSLRLDHTRLTGAELAAVGRLRKLEELSLAGTAITDAGLVALSRAKSLRAITVLDTSVTDAGLEKLIKLLPRLSVAYAR